MALGADLFGYGIALMFIIYIFAISYKKKTGRNVSELWKDRVKETAQVIKPDFQRFQIKKGVKM